MPLLPTVGGSTNTWGTELNDFLQVAHNTDGTLISSGGGYASTQLVRYVDYINGNDGSAGLSPTSAMKTINAAIDDLETVAAANYTPETIGTHSHLGIGTIYLMPGDHQIGSEAITITPYRYVEIIGHRSGMQGPRITNSGARIVSDSSSLVAMLTTGVTDAVQYGNHISNVSFVVTLATNTSLEACIRTINNDFFEVDHCTFRTHDSAGASDIVAIDMDALGTGQDNAWFRITNNYCGRLQFFRAQAGSNFNRATLSENLSFYDGGTTLRALPHVHLIGEFAHSLVANNNWEGYATGCKLEGNAVDKNMFLSNSGEDATSGTTPFYDVTGSCQFNTFIGGDSSAPGVVGTWIQFAAAAHSNIVIGHYDLVGATGFKQKIVDNSTLGNIYLNPNGLRHKLKSGAGVATIADSDFSFGAPNVDNGQLAVIHNTSDGVSRLAVKVNGAWKYVVVA